VEGRQERKVLKKKKKKKREDRGGALFDLLGGLGRVRYGGGKKEKGYKKKKKREAKITTRLQSPPLHKEGHKRGRGTGNKAGFTWHCRRVE